MKISPVKNIPRSKLIIKKCHLCGKIIESYVETKKCPACRKNFLPLRYSDKVSTCSSKEYDDLFAKSDDLSDEDLIKGIYVLW